MVSFVILFGVILATIYLALMYNSEAIMLLVFMEAAFFVISVIFIFYRKYTIKASIKALIGISETGKENLIKILVNNDGYIAVSRMKALVTVENTITGKKNKRWMTLAGTQDDKTEFMQNIVFGEAGNYEIRIECLRLYDITGLMYGHKKVKSMDTIQVMPKMYDIVVRMTMAVKNFYGESEIYDEHNPGHDNSELFDVREYQQGDRIQSVHWKMTAKQDELMVKEHSMPKSCPVVLVLDYKLVKNRKDKKKAIHFAEIASSLSFSMMDAGCPHYVVWYDDAMKDIVRARVDDEESMFYCMGMIMNIKWVTPNEDILERYKDKYRAENYVWMVSLNEKLEIRKGDDVLAMISEKSVKEDLSQVELVL